MDGLRDHVTSWWAAQGVPKSLGLILTGFVVLCAVVALAIVVGHLFEGGAPTAIMPPSETLP